MLGGLRSYATFCERRALWILLITAAFVFSANAGYLSLKSYDDCYYAQKGLEMWRSGIGFTVTLAGTPDFANPPLPFWMQSWSHSVIGEGDFAARLPSILTGLLVLLVTYRIGLLAFGRRVGLAACAALLVTPLFVTYARRCMTEMPLTLGTTAAVWLYLESLERPKLAGLIAFPLGAAVLSKSVFGLLPVLVFAGTLLVPRLQRSLRNPWLWLGVFGGILLGASWSLHQTSIYGDAFLDSHYGLWIFGRIAEKPLTALSVFTRGPRVLFEHYQPLILPAVAGLGLLVVRRANGAPRASGAVILWMLAPIVLFSFSSTQKPRWLFSLLPVMALLTGYLLEVKFRRVLTALVCYVAPGLCVAAGLLLWISPTTLGGDANQDYKRSIELVSTDLPPGAVLPYLGGDYWLEANPALRYWDVRLERPAASTEKAMNGALSQPHRLLLVVRSRLAELDERDTPREIVIQGSRWSLVRLLPRSSDPSSNNEGTEGGG